MHPDQHHQPVNAATGNARSGRLMIAHASSSQPATSTTTTMMIVLTIPPISGAA
jgi:hypothetical protein